MFYFSFGLFADSTKITVEMFRTSHPEVFLGRRVLKICSKFTGEHPCPSAISIKLITLTLKRTEGSKLRREGDWSQNLCDVL